MSIIDKIRLEVRIQTSRILYNPISNIPPEVWGEVYSIPNYAGPIFDQVLEDLEDAYRN